MKYEKYNKGKNDLFSGIVLGGFAIAYLIPPVALDENTVTGRAFLQLAASVVRQVDKRNVEMAPTEVVKMHK